MDRFGVAAAAVDKSKTILCGKVRISVITDRIIRVERADDGVFEDRASQTVLFRDFANPTFKSDILTDKVVITTKCVCFSVDLESLTVYVRDGNKWKNALGGGNLKGTARTLDMTLGYFKLDKGILKLGNGIFSTEGVTELDDSASYLLEGTGKVSGRRQGVVDKYVFAFGNDYLGGLKEFYALTGFTPLLPKYALGNWWSRYYAYKQDEYVALMDKFVSKDIPLTVATIDMDWHIVKNVPNDVPKLNPFQGAGWTGYTFERSLFPDHKQFFKDLKARGLAVTMNLHPRDGIRYFEEQYPEMARANNVDPTTKKPVDFDFTNLNFVDTYFDLVLHPYEDEGVDFWWIDWQQGTKSKLDGLDPLWLLNHYHTIDAGRNGRTPLILSRYAGVGSHRYPLGFSGDTVVSWQCLKLQPYFTATASNVGYSWWSHDIGGHMFGRGNAELYVRWLQFGVFSPINRLHSSNTGWSKEPWLYGEKAEKIATEFMKLRHRLLPYLYTANVMTAKEGVPLIAPTYYYSSSSEAYKAKNQYYFGQEMLVAPVIKKGKDGKASTEVYLPNGAWTDFFTGEKYEGGRSYSVESPLERIPVFVKSGAIIPLLAERKGNSQTFDELEVRVYSGENRFRMYDEKGFVDFELKRTENGFEFSIKPSEDFIPSRLDVVFEDFDAAEILCDKTAKVDGNRVKINLCDAVITLNSRK